MDIKAHIAYWDADRQGWRTFLIENKENPSISPQGKTGRKKEEILLVPPVYALDKNTHNYEGLMEELARQKVTAIHELNSSPQLKARILMPGKYILKLLQV